MLKATPIIEVKNKTNEKRYYKTAYQRALREYFLMTRGFLPRKLDDDLRENINTIIELDKQNKELEKHEVIVMILMNILAQFIGTSCHSFIVLYFVGEVLDLPVAHGFKNISLLALIIMGYKIKFRLI